MANADMPQVADPGKAGLIQQLRANPRLPLMIGVAVAVTILVGLVLWSGGPSYGVLYSGLSDRDGGEIIAQLDQMQVPYEFAANGTSILVPSDQVDQTRLALAGQGLPKGAGVGFELMDNQSFGISQFAEHVNYNRALEGELARSIETIDAVASARVHLAIPESSVFVRERQQPTASVVLDLYQGRALSDGQVSAITHLVSSSVNHLPVDAVTVVDAGGRLLSASGDAGLGTNATQLDYVAQIEQTYRKRILEMLTPLVGADNVRAQVVADVDFSTGERTQETYGPNQDPARAAVRSEQRNTNLANGGAAIRGIPGALSNQPSPEQPSPVNNPPQGGQNATLNTTGATGLDGGAPGDPNGTSSRSSTVNYEVDRTIEHVQRETGRVRRISAAVVINQAALASNVTQPADGTEADQAQDGDQAAAARPVVAAVSAERMAQIQSLVRGAVGFSDARGDAVEVISAPFSDTRTADPAADVPWWKDDDLIGLAGQLLKYLGLALVALILWRKLVKPLLDQVPTLVQPRQLATPDGRVLAVAGDDDDVDEPQNEASDAERRLRQQRRQQHQAMLNDTKEIARNDPRMVAMIVKGWMSGNG